MSVGALWEGTAPDTMRAWRLVAAPLLVAILYYFGAKAAFAIGTPVEGWPDVSVRDRPGDVGGQPATDGGTSASEIAV